VLLVADEATPLSQHVKYNKTKELAERVGFSKALADRFIAFNAMPKTEVFTGIYLLSHLEHEAIQSRASGLSENLDGAIKDDP
jgi:hypothetical protein